ncbi:hypothetical protein J6590_045924 [Homalodisca vitripennis]|nr:hypothetical protein J6590_045924 [Homalodisca vitripennis]
MKPKRHDRRLRFSCGLQSVWELRNPVTVTSRRRHPTLPTLFQIFSKLIGKDSFRKCPESATRPGEGLDGDVAGRPSRPCSGWKGARTAPNWRRTVPCHGTASAHAVQQHLFINEIDKRSDQSRAVGALRDRHAAYGLIIITHSTPRRSSQGNVFFRLTWLHDRT